MVENKKKTSSITIQKIQRNPDNIILEERYVQVNSHDIKICEKTARKIWKEDLC